MSLLQLDYQRSSTYPKWSHPAGWATKLCGGATLVLFIICSSFYGGREGGKDGQLLIHIASQSVGH